MFLPANQPSLRAVITYYSATANVNQEGDVHINDTLQGFGTVPFVSSLASTIGQHEDKPDEMLFFTLFLGWKSGFISITCPLSTCIAPI